MLIKLIRINTPITIRMYFENIIVAIPINTQMSTIASASKNRLANDFSIFLSCRISPALHSPIKRQINSQIIFANSIRLMFIVVFFLLLNQWLGWLIDSFSSAFSALIKSNFKMIIKKLFIFMMAKRLFKPYSELKYPISYHFSPHIQ